MTPRQPRGGLSTERPNDLLRGRGVAFLASQVGARSSRRWSERLRSIGLDARPVMLFWNVAIVEGRSQRQVADALGLPESRIVRLVDSLEAEGYLERRTRPSDRRARRLHLTGRGRNLLKRVMTVAAEHEADFSRGLQPAERAVLTALLSKVAATHGLLAVHPDF